MNQKGNVIVFFLIIVGSIVGLGLMIGTISIREMKAAKAFSQYNYMPYLSQSAAEYTAAKINSEVSKAAEEYFFNGGSVEFTTLIENIPSQSFIVIEKPFSEEIKQNHSIEIHFLKKDSQIIEAQMMVTLDERCIQRKLLLQLPQQPNEPLTVLK